MSYVTDFPRTRTYDSDLGFLISEYEDLLKKYEIVEETLNNIVSRIDSIVIEEINNALVDGRIFLTTEYDPENKKLKFIFKEK